MRGFNRRLMLIVDGIQKEAQAKEDRRKFIEKKNESKTNKEKVK